MYLKFYHNEKSAVDATRKTKLMHGQELKDKSCGPTACLTDVHSSQDQPLGTTEYHYHRGQLPPPTACAPTELW